MWNIRKSIATALKKLSFGPFGPTTPLELLRDLASALIEFLTYKKTLLTGPQSSGKTTFLQYISKDIIPDAPSGVPRSYQVNNAEFDEVTDLSGAEAWLDKKFDEYIHSHDYILFFFDVSEFLKDSKYRKDCYARIDYIHQMVNQSQKVLMVGTHIDQTSGNYSADTENLFAGKPYQSLLSRIVYIDTRKKDCVKTILDELKK